MWTSEVLEFLILGIEQKPWLWYCETLCIRFYYIRYLCAEPGWLGWIWKGKASWHEWPATDWRRIHKQESVHFVKRDTAAEQQCTVSISLLSFWLCMPSPYNTR